MERIKSFFSQPVIAVIGAMIALKIILLPYSVFFLFSLALFLFIFNYLLEISEKDSATKRYGKKLLLLLAGALAYLGLRIGLGAIFNMPLIEPYSELSHWGLISLTFKSAPQALLLEVLFVPVGAGFAYWFVKGGSFARGVVFLIFLVMFGIVLWQVKQTAHATALKRNVQASITLDARRHNLKAMQKEAWAKLVVAVAKENFGNIKAGQRMALLNDEVKYTSQTGLEPLVEVQLEQNGIFNGPKLLVPLRKIKIVTREKKRSRRYHQQSVESWRTTFEKTYIGIGFSGGCDGEGCIETAVNGRDYKVGDRIVVVADEADVWCYGQWTPVRGRFHCINISNNKGEALAVRAAKGKKITVIIQKKERRI